MPGIVRKVTSAVLGKLILHKKKVIFFGVGGGIFYGIQYYIHSKPPFEGKKLKLLEDLPSRHDHIRSLKTKEFDIVVIGGGATGSAVTLDAVTRGLSVAVIERDDFASGTSSRSTKLIHGGVRYLEKAVRHLDREQWHMVREALSERSTFLNIAPHIAEKLPIMVPVYAPWWNPLRKWYYWAGLKAYDIAAMREQLGSSYMMSTERTLDAFPTLKRENLRGSIVYYDGMHDDARTNICTILTAARCGAATVNHAEVTRLVKHSVEVVTAKADKVEGHQEGDVEKPKKVKEDRLCGVRVKDQLTGEEFGVKAKCVINATGPFTDSIRLMDDPKAQKICRPSSGVHISLPGFYSPRNGMGLLDPGTTDGRVMFFLPWQGQTLVGTTDEACSVTSSPEPTEADVKYLLNEVHKYLGTDRVARRCDVQSVWSGIRPLVSDPNKGDTQSLARNHIITVSRSKLITIAGGKWTTFRHMAEETVDRAVKECSLSTKDGCITNRVVLEGGHEFHPGLEIDLVQDYGLELDVAKHLARTYGDKARKVIGLAKFSGLESPVLGKRLHPDYPFIEAEVIYSLYEYACTPEDFLARRSRLAFLNAEAAKQVLPRVLDIMAGVENWDSKRKKIEHNLAMQFLQKQMGLSLRRNLAELKEEYSEALERDAEHSAREYVEALKAFQALDTGNKGHVTFNDLQSALKKLEVKMPEKQLHDILAEVDINQNGTVELEEYMLLIGCLRSGHLPCNRFAIAAQLTHERDGAILTKGGSKST